MFERDFFAISCVWESLLTAVQCSGCNVPHSIARSLLCCWIFVCDKKLFVERNASSFLCTCLHEHYRMSRLNIKNKYHRKQQKLGSYITENTLSLILMLSTPCILFHVTVY
jgi:hypothetical protein